MKRKNVCVLSLTLCMAVLPALAQDQSTEDEVRTQSAVYRGVVQSSTASGVAVRLSGTGNEITVPHSAIVEMKVNVPRVVAAGLEAYEDGRMPEAARYLRRVIEQYHALDTEWASKGILYYGRASLETGDYDAAEKAFKAFMAWYPDNSRLLEARLGMAQIDVAQERYDVALEKLREIAKPFDEQLKPPLAEVPYAAETYLSIGKCLEAQGNNSEALDSFLTVIALYPDENLYPEAMYRSGMLFAGLGNLKRAEMAFNEIVEDYPSSDFVSNARRERDSIRMQLSAYDKSS